MGRMQLGQSVVWAIQLLGRSVLGLAWLLMPSFIIFNVAVAFSQPFGWEKEMIHLAATNAFIIWMGVQLLFFLFDHHVTIKIRRSIEEYRDEILNLNGIWHKSLTETAVPFEARSKTLKTKFGLTDASS